MAANVDCMADGPPRSGNPRLVLVQPESRKNRCRLQPVTIYLRVRGRSGRRRGSARVRLPGEVKAPGPDHQLPGAEPGHAQEPESASEEGQPAVARHLNPHLREGVGPPPATCRPPGSAARWPCLPWFAASGRALIRKNAVRPAGAYSGSGGILWDDVPSLPLTADRPRRLTTIKLGTNLHLTPRLAALREIWRSPAAAVLVVHRRSHPDRSLTIASSLPATHAGHPCVQPARTTAQGGTPAAHMLIGIKMAPRRAPSTDHRGLNTVADQFPVTGVPLMDAESSSISSSSSIDMI
jgi:hypothetical protein